MKSQKNLLSKISMVMKAQILGQAEESKSDSLEGDQVCPETVTDTILPVRRSTQNIQPPDKYGF